MNPSTSPYSNMTFTGKGRANLVITLNDQQYITAEIDYTTQSINVTFGSSRMQRRSRNRPRRRTTVAT